MNKQIKKEQIQITIRKFKEVQSLNVGQKTKEDKAEGILYEFVVDTAPEVAIAYYNVINNITDRPTPAAGKNSGG